jgi:hypothetical protein
MTTAKALENCAMGFDKHARFWRETAGRTSSIEARIRAGNADGLAALARDGARKARDKEAAYARLVEALEMIEAGHGCPSAVARDALAKERGGA